MQHRLRTAWLATVLIVIAVGCEPTAAPTPSALPLPTPSPTSTPVPPTPTSTPVPTEAPTATPLPTPAEEALVPTGPATPPPPNFDPTPPPPPNPAADDQHTWVRDYVSLVTAMLNSTATVQEVLDILIAWSAPSEELRSEIAPYVWAESADLDGDGAEEWLMSLPVPERGQSPTWLPTYLVIYEVHRKLFVPTFVIRGGPPEEIQALSPELRLIEDITADGLTEVLIQQRWCGAHTCFTGLTVGRYDGTAWYDLAEDPISQAYTDLTIEDRDGDGALEFIMHGGMIGSVGAGLQRQHTLIFDWDDGAYRLVQDIPDPSDHPYYLMLDANAALAERDWERALELSARAVDNPDFEDSMVPVEDVDRRRIISYAAVQAMLVHAHRGDAAQMEALLDQVRGYDFVEPNIYTEAAERLIEVYRDTGDVLKACVAVEAVVAQRLDEAVFFQWYGYNTTRISVDQICPLDAPPDGDSPQL